MSEETKKTFASTLNLLRKTRNMTVQELAKAAHLSPSAVSDFEDGRRMPTPKALNRLSQALGLGAVNVLANDWMEHAFDRSMEQSRLNIKRRDEWSH